MKVCDVALVRLLLTSLAVKSFTVDVVSAFVSFGHQNRRAHPRNERHDLSLDPILTQFIQQTHQDPAHGLGGDGLVLMNLDVEKDDSRISIWRASNALKIWRQALSKGRLPLPQDFEDRISDNADEAGTWPPQPLFEKVSKTMATIQLPRLAIRHPETIPSILRALLGITQQFSQQSRLPRDDDDDDDDEEEEALDMEDYDFHDEVYGRTDRVSEIDKVEQETLEDRIAQELADQLSEEWNDVVSNVGILDQLLGLDHNLLQFEVENPNAMTGFGLEDGIWKHSGWSLIPQLQKQISAMKELKELIREMGRRPTAQDSVSVDRFTPRKQDPQGSQGAEWDHHSRESIHGLHFSSNLSEMLFSEAALLRSKALKPLFLQKLAESKLMSYQSAGWVDVPSVQTTQRRRPKRMPSAPGGPLVVCLDTSWSMSTGSREELSKAVVLACISSALVQKRDCQVVAFSSSSNVEAHIIQAEDASSIERLLDFLSYSFGGGTDVTGALKFAMESIDSESMAAADILLISDGEIPDPPVPAELMQALDHLKLRKGVQVHGLLVGRSESKPFSRLCNKVHQFLNNYDLETILSGSPSMGVTTPASPRRSALERLAFSRVGLSSNPLLSTRTTTGLFAKARYSDDDDWTDGRMKRKKKRKSDKQNRSNEPSRKDDPVNDAFLQRVEAAFQSVRTSAADAVSSKEWSPSLLEKEQETEGSCWKYQTEIAAAIDRVQEGLIERTEEARLVILAMLCFEHVLLLGVPGTGKSILGRRLSQLCNGVFFQRLLTKFTTPEELFGPLSLRALEKDQYKRVTKGYLPQASVAFLDEIFKANSAILNTLLTILNERKFDNAGGQDECPIRCVVGASNELPESDELDALFDRFLIRKEVNPVSDDGLFELLSMSQPGSSSCDSDSSTYDSTSASDDSISEGVSNGMSGCDIVFTDGLDEVVQALSQKAEAVEMGQDVLNLIRDLRAYLRDKLNVEISDRRLVKTSRLLKICAASNGRSRVDLVDCMILQHCLWQNPEQRASIREWLFEHLVPGSAGSGSVQQFRFLLDGLRDEVLVVLRVTSGDVSGDFGGRAQEIALIKSLREETRQLASVLEQKWADILRTQEVLERATHCFLDLDEQESMKQLLVPRAASIAVGFERTLMDATMLAYSITEDNTISPEVRAPLIEKLWETGAQDVNFSEAELEMSMKEAKAKYELDTFRKWKRAKKKAGL